MKLLNCTRCLLALRLVTALSLVAAGCGPASPPADSYDLILRGGTVYDGSGSTPIVADVAISGDTIAAIGDLAGAVGAEELDVTGLAVAPGFINMLSWATESLIQDGRSLSDIRQGVTLEVFGEGWSMGPLTDEMKAEVVARQGDIKFDVTWTTLGEYLDHLVQRGVSANVASYVGATTVRIHVLGYQDRPPTPAELEEMRNLVRQAMAEGALGVGSSLIYAPAFYADTEELTALAAAAGETGGAYISHIRSEGNRLLESVDELIAIAREAGVPAEIYHLKAAGRENWDKLGEVVERVEAARAEGLRITADMYNYTAGATGLDAAMPPWVQEGGHDAWVARLADPATRARVIREMRTPTQEWENLMMAAGTAENVLLVGFKADSLKHLTGRSLAEVAAARGVSPEEAAIDLVIRDDSRVGTVYFIMSEDNIRRKIALSWVSFCSDAESLAPVGPFLLSNPHAIRKLTSFPAQNLGIRGRGSLAPGYFADVVVFDPAAVQDHATFQEPHQLATGVLHVFVNGRQVLADGEHTGALPGRVVRGPGWTGGAGGP
jgi:N-acyl-D-amino-acid deacylase